jgi:integrase/recombinase XerD
MTNKYTNRISGLLKTRQNLRNSVATLLTIPFRRRPVLRQAPASYPRVAVGSGVYTAQGRKYLSGAERRRFLQAARTAKSEARLFCLLLAWTGCRISEALALTAADIDLDDHAIQIMTLKRRRAGVVRQIPVPPSLLRGMNRFFGLRPRQRDPRLAQGRLWPWSRSTGWRRVKEIMDVARIYGTAATPKGLRHTYGVAAFQAVPPHLVQRWLGHASLRTTAIYGDVMGAEEVAFARRVWKNW